MTEQERFEELVSETVHASTRGIWMLPIYHDAEDGELINLKLTALNLDPEPGDCCEANVVFDVSGGSGSYREFYQLSNGDTAGHTYKLPYDFSEAYELGNIWEGTPVGEAWPATETLGDARSVIDFLADRLNSQVE